MNDVRRGIASLIVSFWGMSTCAVGAEYRDGAVALSNDDAPKAVKIWTPLAENGDPISQQGLGQVYSSNWKGLKKDYRKAVLWFERCEPKLDTCALRLANLYNDGNGTKKDPARAAELYARVAATKLDYPEGIGEARTKLGVLHLTGELGKKDRGEGERWIRPAAEMGYADAQMWLGNILNGNTAATPEQLIEAAKWYRLATYSAKDDVVIRLMSKQALEFVEKKLTMAERQKAAAMANAWQKTSR